MTARLMGDLVVFGAICLAQFALYRAVRRRTLDWEPMRRSIVLGLLWFAFAWSIAGLLLSVPGINRRAATIGLQIPSFAMAFLSGSAYIWAFITTGALGFWRLSGWLTPRAVDPSRRRLLQSAAATVPVVATGYGVFIGRTDFQVSEIDLPIVGLAPDLHNLRIAQLSDIHLSPFLSGAELARVVEAANEARPHVTVVTGDLISRRGDPLDECLAIVSRLKSDSGVYGCHGNHEVFAQCEDYATREGARRGVRFLRLQAQPLKFGNATLNLVGVDYQASIRRHEYLKGTEKLQLPGATNLLLSHNPDVFPVAVAKGFEAMLAGHTHGGQVTFEILEQTLNVARLVTPYVYGLYREGRTSAYVTRGIGTIGIPVRLGARPELAVLRLVPASVA